jgi:hypothetical protein
MKKSAFERIQINKKIEAYIYGCIDASEYGLEDSANDDKIKSLFKIFLDDYCCVYTMRKHGNYTKTFAAWIQGSPLCFNIDHFHGKILIQLRSFGLVDENTSGGELQQMLDNWFISIARHCIVLAKRYGVDTDLVRL